MFDSAQVNMYKLCFSIRQAGLGLPMEQSNMHSIYLVGYVCLPLEGFVHYMFILLANKHIISVSL